MAARQAETGNARADAELEIPAVAEAITYFARNATRFLAPQRMAPSGPLSLPKRLRVTDRPYPVAGVITPRNFPLLTPGSDVTPALLSGAAGLLNSSEATPLTALELARGWHEIGARPVFSVVPGAAGRGAQAGEVRPWPRSLFPSS
ncbi:aldehyde dehydrogenase family protein [Amycolatopsis sp. A1MSW2902]|uniref:aldehyde dehydrogenase family protein n=1 Tax=Amycolatopsis sp. A1MSW2902 TaxID=687413 RepID=UPI00307F9604